MRLLNLLSIQTKTPGVITASVGNHALALAYHGKRLGFNVTVVIPETASLMKVN